MAFWGPRGSRHGAEPVAPGTTEAVLYRYRGCRSRLGCAGCSRQETCIGRGVCAGLLSTGTGFCYSQFWLSFLSRRGACSDGRVLYLGLWLRQYPPVPCFWWDFFAFFWGRDFWQRDTGGGKGGILGFCIDSPSGGAAVAQPLELREDKRETRQTTLQAARMSVSCDLALVLDNGFSGVQVFDFADPWASARVWG